jgi:hypothetical protein
MKIAQEKHTPLEVTACSQIAACLSAMLSMRNIAIDHFPKKRLRRLRSRKIQCRSDKSCMFTENR